MSVLHCSRWGVNLGLLKGSDILDNDLAVLLGHIIVLSTCILGVIGDHINS